MDKEVRILIRKATKTDVPALVDIVYLVLAELYVPLAANDQDIQKQKKDLRELAARHDVPMSYLNAHVYEVDGVILGALWSYDYAKYHDMLGNLYRLEREEMLLIPQLIEEARVENYYIDTIAVTEAAQNQGIGQKMLQYILANAETEKELALIVDSKKQKAFHIYQKLGFTIKETREMYESVYYYMTYKRSTTK